MKTGFTEGAGWCLVASAARRGRHLVAVVLGDASQGASFSNAAALLNYGFAEFQESDLAVPGETEGTVLLQGEPVLVSATDPLTALVRRDRLDDVRATFVPAPGVALPVHRGQRVGSLLFRTGALRLGVGSGDGGRVRGRAAVRARGPSRRRRPPPQLGAGVRQRGAPAARRRCGRRGGPSYDAGDGGGPGCCSRRDAIQSSRRGSSASRSPATTGAARRPSCRSSRAAACSWPICSAQIDLPVRVDFMSISHYADGDDESGVVRVLKDLDDDVDRARRDPGGGHHRHRPHAVVPARRPSGPRSRRRWRCARCSTGARAGSRRSTSATAGSTARTSSSSDTAWT